MDFKNISSKNKFLRIQLIDFFRGLALCAMFIFHFFWNLNYFGIISVSLYSGFFGLFQKSILFSFIFISGISFFLFIQKNGFSKKLLNHLTMLFVASLGITIFTFLLFPSRFIYFGVIHLIIFSWIAGIVFVRFPKISLCSGVFVIFVSLFFNLPRISAGIFFWLGFGSPLPALDFVPVIPWFGVFLIGLFFGKLVMKNKAFLSKVVLPKKLSFISSIGKKSLFFYLGHQFVLFPLAFLIYFFF